MEEPGAWVGGGSLRIDRARALEVLERFQLPDPDAYLLPWARCAVLSGASAWRSSSPAA